MLLLSRRLETVKISHQTISCTLETKRTHSPTAKMSSQAVLNQLWGRQLEVQNWWFWVKDSNNSNLITERTKMYQLGFAWLMSMEISQRHPKSSQTLQTPDFHSELLQPLLERRRVSRLALMHNNGRLLHLTQDQVNSPTTTHLRWFQWTRDLGQ
jgi:hypothetical protein